MNDLESLRASVQKLTAEVDALRRGQDTLHLQNSSFGDRVVALEKRFTAMETRMTHVDHVLSSLHVDVRRLQQGVDAMKDAQDTRMGQMQTVLDRIAARLGA